MTAGASSDVPRKMRRAVRADMGQLAPAGPRKLRGIDVAVTEILVEADCVIREQVRNYRKVLRDIAWIDAEDVLVHAQYAAIEAHLTYASDRGCSRLQWFKRIIRARLNDVANAILDPGQAAYRAYRAGVPREDVEALRARIRGVVQPECSITAGRGDIKGVGRSYVKSGDRTSRTAVREEKIASDTFRNPEERATEKVQVQRVLEVAERVLEPHHLKIVRDELEAARTGVPVARGARSKQAYTQARQRAFSRLREEFPDYSTG